MWGVRCTCMHAHVSQACRGSINLASAELTIPSDDLHFDVTGLNGAVYLEAPTLAERQRWVSTSTIKSWSNAAQLLVNDLVEAGQMLFAG